MHNPDITILEADPADLDLLIRWRMEVLHCVFSIPADADTTELKQANLDYYTKALSDDSHIACFASIDGQTVGCGGVCLYDEMPSPDNPTGHCAYLMNIYVRPEHRGRGVAKHIVRWLVGAHQEDLPRNLRGRPPPLRSARLQRHEGHDAPYFHINTYLSWQDQSEKPPC